MVKIERVATKQSELATQSLAQEKIKSSGKCNTEEVLNALREIFHDKCYLCESKTTADLEIEHLKPHGGNCDLKFDWENLFLACGRCNHIKGNKFTPILDCTKIEVDEIISFRKIGYFGTEETLEIKKVEDNDDIAIQMTCDLLQRIYYGNTPQEKIAAKMLRRAVRIELSSFKEAVREYNEAIGEDKQDLWLTIRSKLKSNSPFAAFKRWIVRDYPNCKDFVDCWKKF